MKRLAVVVVAGFATIGGLVVAAAIAAMTPPRRKQ